jgi:hypothetical protein
MSNAQVICAAKRMRLIQSNDGKDEAGMQWVDLPDDLTHVILERVIAHTCAQPDVLLNLIASSQFFRNFFRSKESLPMWSEVWRAVRESRAHVCDTAPRTLFTPSEYHRVVALASSVGCSRCRAPRIRKVTWEFGMRVCQTCLTALTVPDFTLTNNGIDEKHWKHLRHLTKEMYNPYTRGNRNYIMRLFLRRDLDAIVKQLYGDENYKRYEMRLNREAAEKAAVLKEQHQARARERETMQAELRNAIKDAFAHNDGLERDIRVFNRLIQGNDRSIKKLLKNKLELMARLSELSEEARNDRILRHEFENRERFIRQLISARNGSFHCRLCTGRIFKSRLAGQDHANAKHMAEWNASKSNDALVCHSE